MEFLITLLFLPQILNDWRFLLEMDKLSLKYWDYDDEVIKK